MSDVREAGLGLRERKKAERYRSLSRAARQLTLERGLDAVSIEDIAALADVSPRTFHNYFSCKEEAIIGVEPSGLADLAARLLARPVEETPFEAVRAVVVPRPDEQDDAVQQWTLRTELVRRYPTLLPLYLAGLSRIEDALVEALGERLGVDPDRDPYPAVLVAAVLAVVRSTRRWCHEHQPAMAPGEVLEANLSALARGFEAEPEPSW